MNKVKEIIDDLEKIRDKKGDKYVIDNFEDTVLKSKNDCFSYYFINVLKVNYVEKHIENIINSKNTKLIYDTMFLNNVDMESVNKLIDRIVELKDAYYCYLIALKFYKSDTRTKLEQVVLDAKDPAVSYMYALNIKDANLNAHQKVVADSKDVKFCYKFAKNIDGTHREPLEQVVIDSNNLEYITKYAEYVPYADRKKLASKIIESNDPHFNYEFAKEVFSSDKKAHGDVVIESKDPKYNYLFALNIKDANIIGHENAVIASKSVEYMYKFALDIKEADVVKLKNELLELASKEKIKNILDNEEFNERYENSIIKNKILSLSKEN